VAGLALAVLSLLAMLLGAGDQEAAHRAAVVAAVALAVAAVGLVLAITAMSGAKRSGTHRPRGALVGVILGVIGLLLSGFALLGFLIFSAQFDQYDNCLNGANTVAEQQACQTQFENAITNRIRAVGGN
jgi:multisubunit Na+/H+ antiporter MnhB subunit